MSSLVITNAGVQLMAKLAAGEATSTFTKLLLSSKQYSTGDLEGLTSLSNVQQEVTFSSINAVSTGTVKLTAVAENTSIKEGFTVNTLGLVTTDGTDEILYAVIDISSEPDFQPAYDAESVSRLSYAFTVQVGRAASVNLQVVAATTAMQISFDNKSAKEFESENVQDAIVEALTKAKEYFDDLQAFVGYNDDDIYGVEVDFKNNKFTRLAGAKNLTPGTDFDNIEPWHRRRCNVTNAGEVIAYYGDDGYTETGALTKTVTVGSTTYAVGTKVQVMVEQPKFYYKVVPLELEKIQGGKGFHMRKARYYVSDTMKAGFKLHPAFVRNGSEKNFIYPSAFEGCLYDTSASKYITDDSQVMDTSADLLCSIAGAKPASGISQSLTRAACRQLAANRGTGWTQEIVQAAAATELLFLIEYASFNAQESIGRGVCDKTDDGKTNMSNNTGATSSLGNASGMASGTNGLTSVTYRGEENFWSNIWDWIDGLNHYKQSVFIADHDFKDDTGDSPYSDAGITASYSNGFVSAFAYNEAYDWLFIASECLGDSALPVGDYFWINPTYGWLVAVLGAGWYAGAGAGGFCWYLADASSGRGRAVGGRLLYVPEDEEPSVRNIAKAA